ncbi:hypothetical protein H6768_03945 [Candidatus Peribacteria bacterium]|nr:hypothetical protein [Candidatus Peribacteria bacterium]
MSEVASTQTNTPESISAHISEQQKSDIVTQVPSSSDPLIHAIETLIPVPPTPPEQENKTITELDVSPVPALPESHQENSSPEQVEKSDASTGALSLPHDSHQEESDPHLSQYLHADTIYQQMMKIESHEKIRLHLAIKYTLLMFAIFLVFAWIVSNRVIMFGFSEFVWLARIRDGLFALMAGLFALTLWFGSVTWTRHILLISVIRTIALVFFGAVIIALYIPFW